MWLLKAARMWLAVAACCYFALLSSLCSLGSQPLCYCLLLGDYFAVSSVSETANLLFVVSRVVCDRYTRFTQTKHMLLAIPRHLCYSCFPCIASAVEGFRTKQVQK